MRLYLDTSALLRAELERDLKLRRTLAEATQLFACRLLHVEAARALRRLEREHPRRKTALQSAEDGIAATLASCLVAQLGDNVLTRAQLDFPLEPVRSLDAIHLAAALWWRDRLSATGDALMFASTDDCLRANAAALGFPLIP
jgi:predicted nucleic acid-binding protein